MRTWLGAVVVSAVALMVAGVLGVAGADPVAPGGQRAITINGVGSKVLRADASDADRDAAYQAALRAAVDQAQARAQFVAQRLGVTLGPVSSAVEQSQEDLYPCGKIVPHARRGEAGPAARQPAHGKPTPARPSAHRRSTKVARDAHPAGQECRQYASVSVTFLIG